MVNLRKIGAVATGAMFVGATIGMASAVTVPDGFSSSMLADNGVAKAQLVVGKDAPGKVEDKASAEIIQEAVKTELAVSGTGGQIKIEYGEQDLDDDGNPDYWTNTSGGVSIGGTSNLNLSKDKLNLGDYENAATTDYVFIEGNGLRFDANNNGDLDDSSDYTLYDGVWIIDGDEGTIRFGYVLGANMDSEFSTGDTSFQRGEVVKIKGADYAFTKVNKLSSGEVQIGPAITKKITDTGDLDPDRAVVVAENFKIFYDHEDSNGAYVGTINFYEGNQLLDSYELDNGYPKANETIKLNDEVSIGDFEDKYDIFLVKNSTTSKRVYMTFVDKDQKVPLENEDEDVMGYDLVWVDNDKWDNQVVLLSSVVSLVQDDTIDLEGTYYQLKFTDEKELDIKREKTETQSSGEKWKESKYDDFLTADVWISATGGEIKIKYGIQNLDDDGGADYWTNTSGGVSIGGTSNLNLSKDKLNLGDYENAATTDYVFIEGNGLRFDANNNGDLDDSSDYTLYDGVWIIDGDEGTIRFGYVLGANMDSEFSTGDTSFQRGEVVKIKGTDYAFTKVNKLSSGEVQIGSAITKKITDTGALDPDRAVVVAENFKIFYDQDLNAGTSAISFYEGNQLLDSYELDLGYPNATQTIKLNDEVSIGDFEDKYDIFLVKNSTADKRVYMTFVDKDNKVPLENEEEDVLGYDLIWVDNDKWDNQIVLLSSVVELVQDDTIDLEGTYYQLKFTDEKELDIKREKTETQSSGEKWKETKYDDFLTADVWISVTGGETTAPDIEIVENEDDADTDMNLVLIGGPVANQLTAQLVTGEKSTVNWYESDGDIEVIADAFTTGKTAIIVAGKTREETKAAAQALADAL